MKKTKKNRHKISENNNYDNDLENDFYYKNNEDDGKTFKIDLIPNISKPHFWIAIIVIHIFIYMLVAFFFAYSTTNQHASFTICAMYMCLSHFFTKYIESHFIHESYIQSIFIISGWMFLSFYKVIGVDINNWIIIIIIDIIHVTLSIIYLLKPNKWCYIIQVFFIFLIPIEIPLNIGYDYTIKHIILFYILWNIEIIIGNFVVRDKNISSTHMFMLNIPTLRLCSTGYIIYLYVSLMISFRVYTLKNYIICNKNICFVKLNDLENQNNNEINENTDDDDGDEYENGTDDDDDINNYVINKLKIKNNKNDIQKHLDNNLDINNEIKNKKKVNKHNNINKKNLKKKLSNSSLNSIITSKISNNNDDDDDDDINNDKKSDINNDINKSDIDDINDDINDYDDDDNKNKFDYIDKLINKSKNINLNNNNNINKKENVDKNYTKEITIKNNLNFENENNDDDIFNRNISLKNISKSVYKNIQLNQDGQNQENSKKVNLNYKENKGGRGEEEKEKEDKETIIKNQQLFSYKKRDLIFDKFKNLNENKLDENNNEKTEKINEQTIVDKNIINTNDEKNKNDFLKNKDNDTIDENLKKSSENSFFLKLKDKPIQGY